MTEYPEHRNLAAFARWFLAQPIMSWRPPARALYEYETEGGTVSSIVLYRRPPYQVELFTVAPGRCGSFSEHRHPDVDSVEVMLSGALAFTIRGKRVASDDELAAVAPDGARMLCGALVRVRAGALHGAFIGADGAAFLSIQRWLRGIEPTSVGLNWDGAPHHAVAAADP